MPDTYDHITLMCRLKAAQRRNKELESGERYIQLEELHQKEYNVYEHKIEKLKKELADAHKETIRVRNYWFQVLEDMLREFEKAQKRSAQELRKMEIRALNAEKQREDALDKAAVFRHQFYEAASRLEEEQGKNLKLRAQINRDYENSSIPSSKQLLFLITRDVISHSTFSIFPHDEQTKEASQLFLSSLHINSGFL